MSSPETVRSSDAGYDTTPRRFVALFLPTGEMILRQFDPDTENGGASLPRCGLQDPTIEFAPEWVPSLSISCIEDENSRNLPDTRLTMHLKRKWLEIKIINGSIGVGRAGMLLHEQLGKLLLLCGIGWNCHHAPGECPVLGFDFRILYRYLPVPNNFYTYTHPESPAFSDCEILEAEMVLPFHHFQWFPNISFHAVEVVNAEEVNAEEVIVIESDDDEPDPPSCNNQLQLTTPPPPPPPPQPIQDIKLEFPTVGQNDGSWALRLRGHPDLLKKIEYVVRNEAMGSTQKRFSADENFLRLINITPRQQIGPTCGLTALSYIVRLIRPTNVHDDLLPIARQLELTKLGEMFSAEGMACLAFHVLHEACNIAVWTGNPLYNNADKIFQMLREEHTVLLVPYDNDVDHTPGYFRGHKAHWCAVVGSVVYGNNRFFVAAQGKTLGLGIWRYDVLAGSNNQLHQADPGLLQSKSYQIGDLVKDLSGQIVVIQFKKNALRQLPVVYVDEEFHTLMSHLDHVLAHTPTEENAHARRKSDHGDGLRWL